VRDKKKCAYAIVLAVLALAGGIAAYFAVSNDVWFSVVMSQSMQHDNDRSMIGVIDTGDIVLVKDPAKSDIQGYVEGTQTGKFTFGDYGSVIIYNRGSDQNPVIHRAIVWLDYDPSTGKWSAPTLEGYQGIWSCSSGTDPYNITGTLAFSDITQSHKNVSIDLTRFNSSGFLTMGDNIANSTFDQNSSIVNHLIAIDDIKSVPFLEIPWIGTLKIYLKNDGNNLEHVPNSIPSLIMCLGTLFAILFTIDIFAIRRSKENLEEEMGTIYYE
jgi:signal peptidase